MAILLVLRASKRLTYRGLSWGTWLVLALELVVLTTLMTVAPTWLMTLRHQLL